MRSAFSSSTSGIAWLAFCLVACRSSPLQKIQGFLHAPASAGAEVHASLCCPPVVSVIRQGDPQGAVAATVWTTSPDDDQGSRRSVALAVLVRTRLQVEGFPQAEVIPTWDGYRVRMRVQDAQEAEAFAHALARAWLLPVDNAQPLQAQLAQSLNALAHRPLPPPALLAAARCTGELSPPALPARVSVSLLETLETWRKSVHGRGRIALATTGEAALPHAVARALAQHAWPAIAPVELPLPSSSSALQLYPHAATPYRAVVTITVPLEHPLEAVRLASIMGEVDHPLLVRLQGLDPSAHLLSLHGGVHAQGGCVAFTLGLGPREEGGSLPERVAGAVQLVHQELLLQLDAGVPSAQKTLLQSSDPQETAERAAWWALARSYPPFPSSPPIQVAVGVGRQEKQPQKAYTASFQQALARMIPPPLERQVGLETGQQELWVLLADPCGTLGETAEQAGTTATVLHALRAQGAPDAASQGVTLEEWIRPEGVGLLAHAPAREGETSLMHAHRVADPLGKVFAAEALDAHAWGNAQLFLQAHAERTPQNSLLGTVAETIFPASPSRLWPFGTLRGLQQAGYASALKRLASLRAAPLRAAVLANGTAAQAEAVFQRLERWLPPTYGAPPACGIQEASPVRTGTYAMPFQRPSTQGVVWFSFACSLREEERGYGDLLLHALNGQEGLLVQALRREGSSATAGAHLLGPSPLPFLMIRLVAPEAEIDTAVQGLRVQLETFRCAGIPLTMWDALVKETATERLRQGLDPRERLRRLWQKTPAAPIPSFAQFHAWLRDTLRAENLLLVAVRPPA